MGEHFLDLLLYFILFNVYRWAPSNSVCAVFQMKELNLTS